LSLSLQRRRPLRRYLGPIEAQEAVVIVVLPRPEHPDKAHWPGRRLLALADAVAWPLVWIWHITHAALPTGVVGPTIVSLAVLFGFRRSYIALCNNHRYRFTTWRWGKIAAGLLLIGLVMKLMVLGSGMTESG
jgi:hypothetical protein